MFFGSVDYLGMANATTSDLSVTLDPVISIRVTKNGSDIDNLTLSVDPVASGKFIKDDLSVLVSTSNDTGYTLTMSDNDTDTAMHHLDASITATIPSISTNATEASFPMNSWGYSLEPKVISGSDNTTQTFSSIPQATSPAAVKTTTAPTTEDATSVTFAAKVDTSVPAGVYRDTIVFSATTNYVPQDLTGLTNMQDMTPEICAASTVGDEAILTDTRDNKTYVVRKLADGKCWMAQNLRLGGSSPITLTPADSNVTSDFTLSATSNSFGATNNAAGVDINRMHDNGDAWLNGTSLQTSGTPPSQTQYIGNYYNWYTATAGSGTYSTTADAIVTQSICPKGWRLPNGGAINATTNNGELQQLYNAYGNYSNFISATSAVKSGLWSGSSASSQGSTGDWWSRTASNNSAGYALDVSTSSISPQGTLYKRSGYSVRCVAATAHSYTITYNLDGGTNSSANPTSYDTETATFTLEQPTRPNYAFTGWTGSNGAIPQETVEIPKGTTGNLNYTAHWTPLTYLVNNGSAAVTFTGASDCRINGTICNFNQNSIASYGARYIYTTNVDVTNYSVLHYKVAITTNGNGTDTLSISSAANLLSGIELSQTVRGYLVSNLEGDLDITALQGVKTIGFTLGIAPNNNRAITLNIIDLWLEE
ncbi:InlB B-repeat-containing protein [Candidatus Saccharibacteria bacterium]|nr:InlB B-repeat-containing protein [Candidatus Saccharibacteria bacterium]